MDRISEKQMEEYQEWAEFLRAVAHPVRLCIVRGLLEHGECNVSRMEECLRTPQSTVSQHLTRLRSAGIVNARREGVERFYYLADRRAERLIRALFDQG